MPIDPVKFARAFPSLLFFAPERGILELVIANPGRLNAATEDMHRDLARVWLAIDVDDEVRAVIVRGEGANFSSGGDFGMIDRMIDDEATLIRVWKEAGDLVYNLINCSKPVVSAIRGSAVGAGLAIALLADVSIAADNARILDGHTRLGVAAGDHAVIIWPLLCGLAKARYHLLTNKPVSGAEAERIGLVALCVADDQVVASAFEAARILAAGSATAVRFTKHALDDWLRLAGPSFDTSLALEFLGFRLADVREGLAAARAGGPRISMGPNMRDRDSIEISAIDPILTMGRRELEALQLERLRFTLNHAYADDPCYRRSFDAAGVGPQDLRSLQDLARFPFTTKAVCERLSIRFLRGADGTDRARARLIRRPPASRRGRRYPRRHCDVGQSGSARSARPAVGAA